MKLYCEKIQLASMRGISWHVVEFSGERGVYANSLSGPFYLYIRNLTLSVTGVGDTYNLHLDLTPPNLANPRLWNLFVDVEKLVVYFTLNWLFSTIKY